MNNMGSFANGICRDLSIAPVTIKEIDRMNTDTQLGACDYEHRIIYIRDNASDPDTMFAIAHELRHMWQLDNKTYPAHIYDPSETDSNTYNLQPDEIDANAYGMYVMSKYNLTPLFNGLSPKVKAAITKRCLEIGAAPAAM
jgi:hypothetical protein